MNKNFWEEMVQTFEHEISSNDIVDIYHAGKTLTILRSHLEIAFFTDLIPEHEYDYYCGEIQKMDHRLLDHACEVRSEVDELRFDLRYKELKEERRNNETE